jgi:RNA polymerase sigma factor (sigma-70 family)
MVSRCDQARFEELYRAGYGAVLRFAARRTDSASAEEVVAETFAVAWRRLDTVPRDDPLPWLYVVARNELANRRRAAVSDRRKTASAGALLERNGRDPADALAERDIVLRAFATLAEPDREALRLVAWENLNLAAGARVAGTSRAAFAMRVSRARRLPEDSWRTDHDPRYAGPAAGRRSRARPP